MRNNLTHYAVAAFVTLIVGTFISFMGYQKGKAQCAKEQQKSVLQTYEAHARASAAYQAWKNKQKVQYVEIEKIIERPIYSSQCFDNDGVRIINNARNAN